MSSENGVKKAAELLKQGAVMLEIACPICNFPLFRMKSGEVLCPNHGRVYIVKTEEEERQIKSSYVLDEVEEVLVQGLYALSEKLRKDPTDQDSIRQLVYYLDAIERLKKIRKEYFSSQSQKQS